LRSVGDSTAAGTLGAVRSDMTQGKGIVTLPK